jgi:ABC-2 type transport system ATP-binding protein
LIRVQDFHKHYRGTVAVAGLSFEVRAGQVLGLVGPNGAGKTTTLRAITGIIPPTRGVLQVGGHDVQSDPLAAKQMLAYIPDDPALFGSLTVYEHLLFSASAYGVTGHVQKAQLLLEQFEIADRRDTLAQEVSRGVRQKVAICAAYMHDAQAILFDEPMTGLDPRGIRIMKDSIRQRASGGAAVVISSHLLSLIEDLCTHLLVLDKGRCLFSGPMTDARALARVGDREATLEEVFLRIVSDGVAL